MMPMKRCPYDSVMSPLVLKRQRTVTHHLVHRIKLGLPCLSGSAARGAPPIEALADLVEVHIERVEKVVHICPGVDLQPPRDPLHHCVGEYGQPGVRDLVSERCACETTHVSFHADR